MASEILNFDARTIHYLTQRRTRKNEIRNTSLLASSVRDELASVLRASHVRNTSAATRQMRWMLARQSFLVWLGFERTHFVHKHNSLNSIFFSNGQVGLNETAGVSQCPRRFSQFNVWKRQMFPKVSKSVTLTRTNEALDVITFTINKYQRAREVSGRLAFRYTHISVPVFPLNVM